MQKAGRVRGVAICMTLALLADLFASGFVTQSAGALGVVPPGAPAGLRQPVRVPTVRKATVARKVQPSPRRKTTTVTRRRQAAKPRPARVQSVPLQPQTMIGRLNKLTLAPGVVHRFYRGPLSINVLDVDMVNAPVQVRPVLSGNSFPGLSGVKSQADQVKAIAAVNANYFKLDGTPLGTLIMDGEWVAGPLYERVSMGITSSGYIHVDRVNLHGILETSNPEAPSIWVNNVNAPRRTGSRLIAYTRRWGSHVKLPYTGCLVAVDSQGRVVDTGTTSMGIPWGGYVLTDLPGSKLGKLKRGDQVKVSWHAKPDHWNDVVHAISGGPILVRNGKVFVDVKQEMFRAHWTGSQIHARTAAGVTNDNHLLLVTVEGPHTLWDLAKFMHALGAVEAMNLDGGGSTTMVVKGNTVTRNANSHQRRVANSLAIVDARTATASRPSGSNYQPTVDLTDFSQPFKVGQLSDGRSAGGLGFDIVQADAADAPLFYSASLDSEEPSLKITN